MIAFDPSSECERAEQYYYDFLVDDTCELVPEAVVDHLGQCEHCRERMRQLEEVLSRTESGAESETKLVNQALATILRIHFAYIGRDVTCNSVKPFLPTLIDPALEVRIPTPITAHIDNCSQCAEDVEAIRSLNLDRKQLRWLSELFAEAAPPSSSLCPQDSNAVRSVAAMDFEDVSAETLSHVCKCPGCRGLLHDERLQMLEKLTPSARPPEFPCESVSSADVFDYVVPYGLDPAKDQYGKFRKAFVSHVVTCPDCLSKMHQVHGLVYGIVERPESGVVTVYNVGESEEPLSLPPPQEFYGGFPIMVEVKQRKDVTKAEERSSSRKLGVTPVRRPTLINLRSLPKVGLAAAAVVLVGFALFFSTPTAKGLTIQQVYRAIETARNVYIARFVTGRSEPVQEQWVSRTLKVQLTKTEGQLVLWDIAGKVRKVKRLESNVVETTSPSAEVMSDVEGIIAGFCGLVPFDDLSAIPAEAEWSRVAGLDSWGRAAGLEAYELKWFDKSLGGLVKTRKWRVFVEPGTSLPRKIELYEKLPSDTEFSLESTKVVRYLSEGEFRTVFEEMFP